MGFDICVEYPVDIDAVVVLIQVTKLCAEYPLGFTRNRPQVKLFAPWKQQGSTAPRARESDDWHHP